MTDVFKPSAPAAGRDWLARGFGIRRCTCPRCAPPPMPMTTMDQFVPTPTVIADLDKVVNTEVVEEQALTELNTDEGAHV